MPAMRRSCARRSKASVNRFLTLNTRHFTPEVAAQSGLMIQTPAQFMEDVRLLVSGGL